MTLADLGALGHRIVADPQTPGWRPLEQEMLAAIDIEKLLAVERATVEKQR
jgi:hypothetical protein